MLFHRLLCLTILIVFSQTGYSEYNDSFNWSGFMSVGAGKLSEKNLLFLDYEDEVGFNSDTLVGVQLDYISDSKWSFTGQVIALGYNPENGDKFKPEIEWAFFSYPFTSNLRARFGKLRSPHSFASDYLFTGYAYPWSRPPVDVNQLFIGAFSNTDGFDIEWTKDFAESTFSFQFILGRDKAEFTASKNALVADATIDIKYNMGLVFLHRNLNTTLRFATFLLKTSIYNDGVQFLSDNLKAAAFVDPFFEELGDDVLTLDRLMSVNVLGFHREFGALALQSEYIFLRHNDKASKDLDGFYLSGAYQINAWLPYIVMGFTQSKSTNELTEAIQKSYAIAPDNADYAFLKPWRDAVLDFDRFGNQHQITTQIGARYDINSKAAVKFDVTYFNLKGNTSGQLGILTLEEEVPSSVYLYNIKLDMVF